MIGPRHLDAVRRILRRATGQALDDSKLYLVESRLEPVAREAGFATVAALVEHAAVGGRPELEERIAEAMTTHESLFFRDERPFAVLRTRILPELLQRRGSRRRLRVWSAGCAAGQEAYSVAMLLADLGPRLEGWSVEIVATDRWESQVQRTRTGTYNAFEVRRGLPAEYRDRFFEARGGEWRVRTELRGWIRPARVNLLEPFGHLGRFDLVLCRNVLIYLAEELRGDVLRRLADATAEDGYLMMGTSETVLGLGTQWEPLPGAAAAIFRRVPGGEAGGGGGAS